MSTGSEVLAKEDLALAEGVLERVATDVAMITDHEFVIESVATERVRERTHGRGKVHISFKQAYQVRGETRHGCVLVPLPDAMCLAGYLMMVPDEAVKKRRDDKEPDQMTKDALLEMANFVGAAVDGALREGLGIGVTVRSEGCQGVRANVRPAFPYEEGDPLLSVTARAKIHDFPAFDMIVMVPVVDGLLTPDEE